MSRFTTAGRVSLALGLLLVMSSLALALLPIKVSKDGITDCGSLLVRRTTTQPVMSPVPYTPSSPSSVGDMLSQYDSHLVQVGTETTQNCYSSDFDGRRTLVVMLGLVGLAVGALGPSVFRERSAQGS